MSTTPKINKLIQQAGFTLIELSIVLVIIGLIVGGVLTGQDLIRAAEIRATIGQYEKYNTAVNTFRTKYNGIPGDLLAASSTSFGLDPVAGAHAGTAGLGDGNGLIQDTGASLGTPTYFNQPVGETLLIWQQLSAANLVDGSFGSAITTGGQAAATTVSSYLPPAKLGRGNYWLAGSSGGLNYWALSNPSALVIGVTGTATYTIATNGGGLTPIEAYNIDTKLDDGMPNTGIVQARGAGLEAAGTDIIFPSVAATASGYYGAAAVGICTVAGTTAGATDPSSTYNRSVGGTSPACQLRLRFN